jgi:putative ATPase
MKRPLSEELRPTQLSHFFGQDHLTGPKALLSSLLAKAKNPLSILLIGPPGCGKTTLAKIYIQSFKASTFYFHPASHTIADLKKWVQEILAMPLIHSTCILFIDEIHRMNKAQQDVLLPFLEDGTFTLVGATTENPSFHLTSALLSRLRVLCLKPLDSTALEQILEKALNKTGITLSEKAKEFLLLEAKGDARHLLNCIDSIKTQSGSNIFELDMILPLLSLKAPIYDRAGDGHYGLISALHKSIRGSDPQAALYWLARMLEAGEDPDFLGRRFVRMAVEDIGLADPQALSMAIAAWQTYERLGSPEADLAFAELAVYLALSPKSNSIYEAFGKAKELAKKTSHLSPPNTILNAPTAFMKELGLGKDYIYDPHTPEGFSGQNYFPDGVERSSFYQPKERGFEREMKKRKEYFEMLRSKLNG